MNRKHRLLGLALLVMFLLASWTGPAAASTPEVVFSVQSNFGSFRLSLPYNISEDKLDNELYEQLWKQVGPSLSSRYGSRLAEALADLLVQNLKPSISTTLRRYNGGSANPEPGENTPPKEKPPVEPKPVPEQPDPPASNDLSAAEAKMLELVNRERVQNGLKPLEVDMGVTLEARKKSQDMLVNNYFAHTSPTYGSPFAQLSKAGISYRAAGENLAGAPTVERAHTSLMNSPGHRANILNPLFTHVGIGIVEGGPYGMMFTQMFIQK